MKNSKAGNSIVPWTTFLFCLVLVMFYMQHKGREKAAKAVEFVAQVVEYMSVDGIENCVKLNMFLWSIHFYGIADKLDIFQFYFNSIQMLNYLLNIEGSGICSNMLVA